MFFLFPKSYENLKKKIILAKLLYYLIKKVFLQYKNLCNNKALEILLIIIKAFHKFFQNLLNLEIMSLIIIYIQVLNKKM